MFGFLFRFIGVVQGIIVFLNLELPLVSEYPTLIQAIESKKFCRTVKLLALLQRFSPLGLDRRKQKGKLQVFTDYFAHYGLSTLEGRVVGIGKGPGHRFELEPHGTNGCFEGGHEGIRLRTKFSVFLQVSQGLNQFLVTHRMH